MSFLSRPNAFLSLEEPRYRAFVLSLFDQLLSSDIEVEGDLTTSALNLQDLHGTATIKSKASGVLAGLDEVVLWLQNKGVTCSPHLEDGSMLSPGERILDLEGNFSTLLQAERTALNALQRLSGIATQTAELTELIVQASLADAQSAMNALPRLAATRKTPWGYLDKRAVQLGGGWSHRLGLWDAILIKDNHLAALAAGGATTPIQTALERVLASKKHGTFIELEVRSTREIEAFVSAVELLADPLGELSLLLMLDNFSPQELETIIPKLRSRLTIVSCLIELSGGITADNVLHYARCGADILSLGSLTHSTTALDLSMELHHR